MCPLLADTGHSGLSVPFSISKGLTGIFPYNSCTRLLSKLTSTVDKNRKSSFPLLALRHPPTLHDPSACSVNSNTASQQEALGQNRMGCPYESGMKAIEPFVNAFSFWSITQPPGLEGLPPFGNLKTPYPPNADDE